MISSRSRSRRGCFVGKFKFLIRRKKWSNDEWLVRTFSFPEKKKIRQKWRNWEFSEKTSLFRETAWGLHRSKAKKLLFCMDNRVSRRPVNKIKILRLVTENTKLEIDVREVDSTYFRYLTLLHLPECWVRIEMITKTGTLTSWSTHSFEISVVFKISVDWKKNFVFCRPESTTYLIPGIVSEVSAMIVVRTNFRVPFGVSRNIFSCSFGPSAEYSGRTSISRAWKTRSDSKSSSSGFNSKFFFFIATFLASSNCCKCWIDSRPGKKHIKSPFSVFASRWICRHVIRQASR